eukprot:scaffold312264_cov27-Tisochrysis_lutea.AAC.4
MRELEALQVTRKSSKLHLSTAYHASGGARGRSPIVHVRERNIAPRCVCSRFKPTQGSVSSSCISGASLIEVGASMREYDRTLIRVRLPGGLIFEAAFHPQVRRLHASSHLLGKASITLTLEIRAVLACLRPELQGIPSHLFFTPPRTTLDQTMSLAAANLTPAATLILGWDVPLPPDVSAAEPRALLAPHARSLLVPQDNSGHGNMQDNALSFPATRSVSAAPPINGAATLGAISSGIGPSTSTGLSSNASSSRVGAEAERKVPKWLKR